MDDLIGILSSEIRVRNFSQLSNQSYKYLPLTYLVNEIHDDICAGYSTENVYNLCSTSEQWTLHGRAELALIVRVGRIPSAYTYRPDRRGAMALFEQSIWQI
ncbi:predicted protein [Histoplasma capsulatum G186AR]|uniref:Uncharacterized protein n=1 Tax=Ajellomyces capsulatus (strain G186AR / H82 / ATCC MYA-2454 / RMSCC 2432) TaxID=447093 RepID=C0NTM7_AJECG|nr:uncharacterized protein HCBG_06507 [Histoplasma capsulatum G186AR]EEH05388.1 predicted protein [Histoplasma capsulatum G186AR]